jgi:mannose-6-phosphate isomerase class I
MLLFLAVQVLKPVKRRNVKMVKPSEFERVNDYFGINKKLLKPNVGYTKYHYHNCCEVIYPLKGEAVYFNNGQNYCIKPGQILFINTYEMHKSIAGADTFERFLIMYRGAFIEPGPSIKMPDIFSNVPCQCL